MTQPFFPCTISAQSRNNEFLTIKTVVRKTHQNNGHTGSSCLDKAVLAQGGGGYLSWFVHVTECRPHSFDGSVLVQIKRGCVRADRSGGGSASCHRSTPAARHPFAISLRGRGLGGVGGGSKA